MSPELWGTGIGWRFRGGRRLSNRRSRPTLPRSTFLRSLPSSKPSRTTRRRRRRQRQLETVARTGTFATAREKRRIPSVPSARTARARMRRKQEVKRSRPVDTTDPSWSIRVTTRPPSRRVSREAPARRSTSLRGRNLSQDLRLPRSTETRSSGRSLGPCRRRNLRRAKVENRGSEPLRHLLPRLHHQSPDSIRR